MKMTKQCVFLRWRESEIQSKRERQTKREIDR
jgi:hypothetical protein